jgi:hypothetical protein
MLDTPIPCPECEALRREFADACASAWAAMDQPTRDAADALRKLKTEEDLARAEQLLAKVPVREDRPGNPLDVEAGYIPFWRDNPHVRSAAQRMFIHCRWTGHRLILGLTRRK